jgi:outer membrane protein TolC
MKKIALLLLTLMFISTPGISAAAAESSPVSLTVSQAVSQALANNPAMARADANIQADQAGVRSARADLLPEVDFEYSYTGLKETPIMKSTGMTIQTSHRNLYNWQVTVLQPLFTGFALSARLDMAHLAVVARRLEKDQVVLDLTRGVKSACHNLLLQQRLLVVRNEEVNAFAAHKHDAELFSKEGLIRPNDLLQARVALANSVQQQEKVRADVQKAKIQVNRLLNRPLEGELAITDPDAGAMVNPVYDSESLGQAALRNRPLMQLLDVSLKQLDQALRLAKSTWYPTVSLVGLYEQSGNNPAATENDYTNTNNAAVGVQATWKFFQSGKTLAETARVRRRIKALDAGIEGYQNQILQEVRNAVLDCQVARKNIDTATQALDLARENWRISDLQYKEQVATSTDVLDARALLTQADTNYFRAVYGFLNAVAGLDRAVGNR